MGAFLFSLLLGVVPATLGAFELCDADQADAYGTSAYIYDGDTLRLEDGTRVRLLGINSPEIGRDGKPSQPYAKAALSAVRRLIPAGTKIGLRFDKERTDKYGRTLAHVLLENRVNVQTRLLRAGLATTLVVPPNEVNADCYARVERTAMDRALGIWSLKAYQPVSASELTLDARGYRIVVGRVQRIGEGGGAVWLNVAPRVALRIPHADLNYFKPLVPRNLLGKRVMARGWLNFKRGELRMTLHHRAALQELP